MPFRDTLYAISCLLLVTLAGVQATPTVIASSKCSSSSFSSSGSNSFSKALAVSVDIPAVACDKGKVSLEKEGEALAEVTASAFASTFTECTTTGGGSGTALALATAASTAKATAQLFFTALLAGSKKCGCYVDRTVVIDSFVEIAVEASAVASSRVEVSGDASGFADSFASSFASAAAIPFGKFLGGLGCSTIDIEITPVVDEASTFSNTVSDCEGEECDSEGLADGDTVVTADKQQDVKETCTAVHGEHPWYHNKKAGLPVCGSELLIKCCKADARHNRHGKKFIKKRCGHCDFIALGSVKKCRKYKCADYGTCGCE